MGHRIRFPPVFFPLRLVYYTFFPPDFVVLFLDPSSHKMCWSVSSHWSSCYGFNFHHGNNWVHNFSFVLFFFFFLPLKLTETPLISLSSHLDEVKTMEHHSLDHFSSAMQSLLLLKMLSCLYLSASLYLSLIYPDLLFFSVYI
jgi:hypothetical protein